MIKDEKRQGKVYSFSLKSSLYYICCERIQYRDTKQSVDTKKIQSIKNGDMKRILNVRAFVNINEAAQAACRGDFKLADLNYP